MKKKSESGGSMFTPLKKMVLIMKLSALLLLLGFIQVSASVYSQNTRLNLKMTNATIADVFDRIENQTQFYFFYNRDEFNDKEIISVEFNNVKIDEVLQEILANKLLTYEIVGKNIIIKKSEQLFSETIVQQKTISGTVTDQSGSPLPGVTVVVKGTTQGTITDVDGNYTLANVTADATLIFSFVGMKSQEIMVAGKTNINVILAEDAIGIEEVVAIGYGSVSKRDLISAVGSFNADDMPATQQTNFEQVLQGRLAGVSMVQTNGEPGSGINIRIRGTTSLSGSEPLFVIDGVPLVNSYGLQGDAAPVTTLGTLANLNPSDIESVQVLKDASATAIYGSRAANGIILVTTKKGKAGKTSFNADYNFGLSIAPTVPDAYQFANPRQRAEFRNSIKEQFPDIYAGMPSPGELLGYTDMQGTKPYYELTPEEYESRYGNGTNWYDEIFRTANIHNVNLSSSGGTEKFRSFTSLNYRNEEGIIKNNDLKRLSLRANTESNITEKLKIAFNATFNYLTTDRIVTNPTRAPYGGGYDMGGPIQQTFTTTSVAMPYNSDGSVRLFVRPENAQLYDLEQDPYQRGMTNPLAEALLPDIVNENYLTILGATLDYDIFSGLKFTVRGGFTSNITDLRKFYPTGTGIGSFYHGYAGISDVKRNSWIAESYLTLDKKIGKHNLNVVAGSSYEKDNYISRQQLAQNFTLENLGYNSLNLANIIEVPIYNSSDLVLISGFGRMEYNYNHKYFISLSGRYDGSSNFAKNNKWGFFPSGAVSWIISEESFMKNLQDKINLLKVRASYGAQGNQAIGSYQSLGGVGFNSYFLAPNSNVIGIQISNLGNPNLTWETTYQTNVGIDLSFLENKLSFTADYFYRKTENLLQSRVIDPALGDDQVYWNIGSINNRGFELSLNAYIFSEGDFKWNVNTNYSMVRNELMDLGFDNEMVFVGTMLDGLQNAAVYAVGQPLNTFYGYKVVGFLTQEDIDIGYPTLNASTHVGDLKFWDNPDDADGLGHIDGNDQTFIGDANPDFEFGLRNTFSYKNFSLDVFIRGMIGQDVYNVNRSAWAIPNIKNPSLEYINNRDKYPATDANMKEANSFMVEDGSFVKIQNVTLKYNVPVHEIKFLSKVGSAEVYLSLDNLYTFTNYSGWNPEVSNFGNGTSTGGVDNGAYPIPRIATFGVRIGL